MAFNIYGISSLEAGLPFDCSPSNSSKICRTAAFLFFLLSFLLFTSSLHAEILFFQDFNDDAVGQYTESGLYDDFDNNDFMKIAWHKGTSNASIVGSADAYEGHSLRIRYRNRTSGSGSAATWYMDLNREYDELYLSMWIKFGKSFDFANGGKLPTKLEGGKRKATSKPDGTDGWCGRFKWRGNNVSRSGGYTEYVYHPDMPGQYGDHMFWDDGPGGQKYITPGTWQHCQTRFKMNTPGRHDGIIQSWLDGVLVLNRQDIRFRDVDTFSIDAYVFSTFFGGNGPNGDQYIYYDNIIISTHYVEPGAPPSGTITTLRAPRNLQVTAK